MMRSQICIICKKNTVSGSNQCQNCREAPLKLSAEIRVLEESSSPVSHSGLEHALSVPISYVRAKAVNLEVKA